MKIATFNINNINRRLTNLLEWLDVARPDVVCLQELKAAEREFPIAAIESAGYGAAWCGQRTWNGVAILARMRSRRHTPNLAGRCHRYSKPVSGGGDRRDIDCLYLRAERKSAAGAEVRLQIGMARSTDSARARSDRCGCRWFLPVTTTSCRLRADIYPTKSWDNDALVQPASRERSNGCRARLDRRDP